MAMMWLLTVVGLEVVILILIVIGVALGHSVYPCKYK